MSETNDLQSQADALLNESGSEASFASDTLRAAPPGERFSLFLPEHSRRARDLASEFAEIADSVKGEEGLKAVLSAASKATAVEPPDLVRHALMMFMTHHRKGRKLKIRGIEQRAPYKILPSLNARDGALLGDVALDPETQLNWFREDAKANEHHEHWHVVYPNSGLFGTNPPKLNDRHGELFFYMHQQMLARYDTERLGVGLGKVVPLTSYTDPIPEGYDPGPGFTQRPGPTGLPAYSARKPNAILKNYLPYRMTIAGQQKNEDMLNEAISTGKFQNGTKVTEKTLGETSERTVATVSPDYGNHHGTGHVLIALVHATPQDDTPGVMFDTATAIRDPIFWRWHRHVDDMAFRWQEQQEENDFSDAPPVLIRKSLKDADDAENQSPDIILAFKENIVDADENPVDGEAFGEKMFGGAVNWNRDFSLSDATTDFLQTRMETRDIELPDGSSVPVEYLDQKEFGYFIRAENLADEVTEVTVRIFLVAEDFSEDRRMWIEMDKFHRTLQPRQKAVFYQPAEMSSVIRKPGVKPPGSKIDTPDDPETDPTAEDENYCSCGWAYNLLLPRGTTEGMRFRLMVMLTDWNKDQVQESKCGSMSYCGAKNIYPDQRRMGYPFNRRFPGSGSIADSIKAQENMATRDFLIREVT
jgi:tyrosinase